MFVCIFKIEKPFMNILLYMLFQSKLYPILRSVFIVFSVLLIMLFTANLICVSVSNSAHKPLKYVYKILKYKRFSLSFRIKIMAYIERLTETTIGFYCYDIFPLNNYYFYNYLCEWICNFFLILNILNMQSIFV